MAAIETDSPPPLAQQLKDAYVAQYGEWTNPDVAFMSTFYCLMAALEKAGTTDPVKVAEIIGSGLSFETAEGTAQMIDRPDMGNDRTVDCVYQTLIGQLEGDKMNIVATISSADGEAAARILLGQN